MTSVAPLWPRARSVAWAPLVVVGAHAILAAAMGHRRESDPWFHFLGGAAGAYSLIRTFDLFPALVRPIANWPRGWSILLLMTVVALTWELAEFASDRFFGTHIQQNLVETGLDIVLGIAGALATIRVTGIVRKRRGGLMTIVALGITVGMGCADPVGNLPRLPPLEVPEAPRRLFDLGEARISSGPVGETLKLVFRGLAMFFDNAERIWKDEFFILPAGWNVFHENCNDHVCWGRIQRPHGEVIHWRDRARDNSAFADPANRTVWQRFEERPRLKYGLVRRPNGEQVMAIEIGGITLESQAMDSAMLEFARSLTSVPAPCRDCVRPVSPK